MRAAVSLAQEVGACVGPGEVLLGPMPGRQQAPPLHGLVGTASDRGHADKRRACAAAPPSAARTNAR